MYTCKQVYKLPSWTINSMTMLLESEFFCQFLSCSMQNSISFLRWLFVFFNVSGHERKKVVWKQLTSMNFLNISESSSNSDVLFSRYKTRSILGHTSRVDIRRITSGHTSPAPTATTRATPAPIHITHITYKALQGGLGRVWPSATGWGTSKRRKPMPPLTRRSCCK